MAEFPLIPKDYLTTSFLNELKQYIDDKAAEGGGGGGENNDFIVTAQYTDKWKITSHTVAEITNAILSGKRVYVKCHYPGGDLGAESYEEQLVISYSMGDSDFPEKFFNTSGGGIIASAWTEDTDDGYFYGDS